MLRFDGYCHIISHIMLVRDDSFDACQCACNGISSPISGPWCGFCGRMDLLVREQD